MVVGAQSYWSWYADTEGKAEDDLAECARSLLAPYGQAWAMRRSGIWMRFMPIGVRMPAQGWKLHVAATSRSAGDVLAAVMPVLLQEAVPFKFAATRNQIGQLNTVNSPREAAGKFVTVYPLNDAQAVRIAQVCDRATQGLTGPAILSDRPIRPGSLVHYRYGAFQDDRVFDGDGTYLYVIRDPDGNPVHDERRAWYTPPGWVTNPFATAVPAPNGNGSHAAPLPGRPILLNDRYVVHQALKHANKGGVYLAEDRTTGSNVVIKEARAHVEARDLVGGVTDSLRHEARVLGLLGSLRRVPALLEIFEQQGHLFLVLEHIEGHGLREHVLMAGGSAGGGLSPQALQAMIRQLAETMHAVHDAGVLLRDFTPNNLIMMPNGELRVVDLEVAHVLDDGPPPRWAMETPGYASPEQAEGQPSGLPDDYYSLGATIAYVATGTDLYLAADHGNPRPRGERLADRLTRLERDGMAAFPVCDIVLGCMADEPARRWGPRQVLDAIKGPRPPCTHELVSPSQAELARAVDDIGRWLARTVTPTGPYLWPTSCQGLPLDPCNVQSGASGVGLFLCQAIQAGADPALRHLVRTAARWVSDAIAAEPGRPPGLYFGLAGTVWFLTEAASCLEDPDLLQRANTLALALPTSSFNPDLTHGTAGIGLGQLHQWARTGDTRFLERAGLAAQALVTTAHSGSDGVVWPVPKDASSSFAGLTSYGFAHGNAGIAYFLLCAGMALGEERYRNLALEGLETLMRVVRIEHGGATWEPGPGRAEPWTHWCSGSSGVGTVLLRAYGATGDDRYRRMAELAAQAVMRTKWRSALVQCHGLAGDAEFLLDLHDLTGQQRFRDLAWELATAIYAHRVQWDGLVVFPDELQMEVTASFNTGLTGIGAFLLRLLHGGARPLMADELLLQPVQVPLS